MIMTEDEMNEYRKKYPPVQTIEKNRYYYLEKWDNVHYQTGIDKPYYVGYYCRPGRKTCYGYFLKAFKTLAPAKRYFDKITAKRLARMGVTK